MSKKDKVYMVLAVIVGIGLIGVGISQLFSSTVECGGQEMEAGDVCTHIKGDTSNDYDYAEQNSSETGTAWAAIGFGGLMAAGGGGFLWSSCKNSR